MSPENDMLILGVCVFILVLVLALAHYLKRRYDQEPVEISNVGVESDLKKPEVPTTTTLGTEVTRAVEPAHWETKTITTDWQADVPATKVKKSKKAKKKKSAKDTEPRVFAFSKVVKGKLTTRWGCTHCQGTAYSHASSAYNHLKRKH